MTTSIRNAPVYGLFKENNPLTVRGAPVYALLKAFKELPKGIEAKVALLDQIVSAASYGFVEGDLEIGLPIAVDAFGRNTKVTVTVREDHPEIDGSVDLYYDRTLVSLLEVSGEFQIQGEADVVGLLSRLAEHTGVSLTASDFINNPVVGGKVTLDPNPNSYFFAPGSSKVIGS